MCKLARLAGRAWNRNRLPKNRRITNERKKVKLVDHVVEAINRNRMTRSDLESGIVRPVTSGCREG